MENLSNHHVSAAMLARVRRFGDLIWADGNLFAYKFRDHIYVMEPPEDLTDELIEILGKLPVYAEEEGEVATPAAEQVFNDEVFQGTIVFEEASDVDQEVFQQLSKEVFPGVKMEFIPPAEIEPEIFGDVKKEEAPLGCNFDPAVVMHIAHEMAYCLRETKQLLKFRMLGADSIAGSEDRAINEAEDLIEQYAEEFGVDMAGQKDLQLDGDKLHLG